LVEALAQHSEPRAGGRTETQLLDELRRSIRADLNALTLANEPD
jgi:hypothetical protein